MIHRTVLGSFSCILLGCGNVGAKSKFKVLWDLPKREAPVARGIEIAAVPD
jgi:hypothetical protein